MNLLTHQQAGQRWKELNQEPIIDDREPNLVSHVKTLEKMNSVL